MNPLAIDPNSEAKRYFENIIKVALKEWKFPLDAGLLLKHCLQLIEKAQQMYHAGNLKHTYINLVRFSSAMLEVLPTLGPLTTPDKKLYSELKNNHLKWALDESEKLKKRLIEEKRDEIARKISNPVSHAVYPTHKSPLTPGSIGIHTEPNVKSPENTLSTPIFQCASKIPGTPVSIPATMSPPSLISPVSTTVIKSLRSIPSQENSYYPAAPNVSYIRRPNTNTASTTSGSTLINTTQDFLLQRVQGRSPTSMIRPKKSSNRLETIINPMAWNFHSDPEASFSVPDVPFSSTHTIRSLPPLPVDLCPIIKKKENIVYTKPHSPISSIHSTSRVYTEPRFHQSESSFSNVIRGVVGLKNLGNTCFMNSIMQCLYGTVPLVRFFASGEFRQSINRSNPLGTQGRVAVAFFGLIQDMQRNSSTFVAPVLFKDTLEELAPHMMDGTQQDSQEFLTFVLERLHEDLKRPPTRPDPPSNNDDLDGLDMLQAAPVAWERYLIKNYSLLVKLFQGQMASTLQCTICHFTSTTYSPFMYLSLPLPSTPTVSTSLEHCLEEFLRPAILDGEDGWKCPKCRQHVRAIQTTTLTRLPFILLVHLKRFSYTGLFRNKLDFLVRFPLHDLDLKPLLPPRLAPLNKSNIFKYHLYAVSNHYGGLDGGHYTAIVKHGDGHWYYFDDSRVSQCSDSKVVTPAAYNLFYLSSAFSIG